MSLALSIAPGLCLSLPPGAGTENTLAGTQKPSGNQKHRVTAKLLVGTAKPRRWEPQTPWEPKTLCEEVSFRKRFKFTSTGHAAFRCRVGIPLANNWHMTSARPETAARRIRTRSHRWKTALGRGQIEKCTKLFAFALLCQWLPHTLCRREPKTPPGTQNTGGKRKPDSGKKNAREPKVGFQEPKICQICWSL